MPILRDDPADRKTGRDSGSERPLVSPAREGRPLEPTPPLLPPNPLQVDDPSPIRIATRLLGLARVHAGVGAREDPATNGDTATVHFDADALIAVESATWSLIKTLYQ